MMTLASARMFGYEGDGHVRLATSVEFMHTATLLHDDVVDESDLRRGKSTARTIWGNQASVLVGDFLLGQAFKMMVDVGSLRCARRAGHLRLHHCGRRGDAACRSQEHGNHRRSNIWQSSRRRLPRSFQRPPEVGPIIAGAQRSDRAALRDYGLNLGLAFSLLTMRLIMAVRLPISARIPATISAKARSRFPSSSAIAVAPTRSALSGKGLSKAARATTLPCRRQSALMMKHGAIADTVQRARHFGEIARDALAPLKASPQRMR
ncbi:polyprenyl synthetase family protein [Brucella abortus]|nr:polyprenyl synthetase family protein [Brucella abortus]